MGMRKLIKIMKTKKDSGSVLLDAVVVLILLLILIIVLVHFNFTFSTIISDIEKFFGLMEMI